MNRIPWSQQRVRKNRDDSRLYFFLKGFLGTIPCHLGISLCYPTSRSFTFLACYCCSLLFTPFLDHICIRPPFSHAFFSVNRYNFFHLYFFTSPSVITSLTAFPHTLRFASLMTLPHRSFIRLHLRTYSLHNILITPPSLYTKTAKIVALTLSYPLDC